MDPAMLLGDMDPANNFAMGGLPMHFAKILISQGKSIPKTLFLDVMVKKTQILIEHIKKPSFRPLFDSQHWREHCHYSCL